MSKLGSVRKSLAREQIRRTRQLLDEAILAEQKENLYKNGITVQDLITAQENGRKAGHDDAAWSIIRSCYAGIALALEEDGMDRDKIVELVRAVDTKVCLSLGEDELINAVLERLNVETRFGDPLGQVPDLGGK